MTQYGFSFHFLLQTSVYSPMCPSDTPMEWQYYMFVFWGWWQGKQERITEMLRTFHKLAIYGDCHGFCVLEEEVLKQNG